MILEHGEGEGKTSCKAEDGSANWKILEHTRGRSHCGESRWLWKFCDRCLWKRVGLSRMKMKKTLCLSKKSSLAVDDTAWSFLLDPLAPTSAKTFPTCQVLSVSPRLSAALSHLLASSYSEVSYYRKLFCDESICMVFCWVQTINIWINNHGTCKISKQQRDLRRGEGDVYSPKRLVIIKKQNLSFRELYRNNLIFLLATNTLYFFWSQMTL